MKDSYKINADLNFWEFYSASLIFYIRSKKFKFYLLFVLIVILVGSLSGADYDHFIKSFFYSLATMILPLLSLIFMTATFLLLITFISYKSKTHLFKNISYEFNHWGIVKEADNNFSIPWRNVAFLKESASFFFIRSNTDLLIIPKKQLVDNSEIADFREFVLSKINR